MTGPVRFFARPQLPRILGWTNHGLPIDRPAKSLRLASCHREIGPLEVAGCKGLVAFLLLGLILEWLLRRFPWPSPSSCTLLCPGAQTSFLKVSRHSRVGS